MAFSSGKNQRTLNTAFISTRSKAILIKQAATDINDKSLMVATAILVRDWIMTNLPSNNEFLLERSFDVNGRMTLGTLTTLQTTGLRTEINALILTIDD